MHPFRFAVQLSRTDDAASWRDQVRKVEDLGYSTVYLPDHFGDQFAPMVALAIAAEATTTLRVGTLVLGNDYRHPLVVAKEAATLDLLSEGRLELGIGAGWKRSDYEQSGIELDEPAVRVDRLEESIDVMKALWTGRCDHAGSHYTVTGAEGAPLPHRAGGPLLLVGGGSRRVLSVAGRRADIVGLNPRLTEGFVGPQSLASVSAEHYDRRLEWSARPPVTVSRRSRSSASPSWCGWCPTAVRSWKRRQRSLPWTVVKQRTSPSPSSATRTRSSTSCRPAASDGP
ncbi:MAG TPA: TIGR03621 family F420-dependent LLM class oxidoreductase [Acidimicrobiales bacterium]|nr:TIGR03621 family F420-dependent LLM class oxidoreductase [Acidimicrobiales bacterium]